MSIESIREAVEAEQPEEDEQPDAPEGDDDADAEEAEEATPPAPQPTPEDVDRKITRAVANHRRAMGRALDLDPETLQPCPSCGGMGCTPPDFEPIPDPLPDPTLVRCDACNGYGQRTTPSLAPNYAAVPCTQCAGQGFEGREAAESRQRYADIQAAQASQPPAPPAPPIPVWNEATRQYELPASAYSPQPAYSVNGPGQP